MSHVVLITGCSAGIGRDLAQRLAESGYRVVATARGLETLQNAVVSEAIQQALEVAKPKARYLVAVPPSSRLVLHLGDAAWDLVLRRLFHIVPAPATHSEARPAAPLDTRAT